MFSYTRYLPLLLLVVIGSVVCWDLNHRQRLPEGVDGNLVFYDDAGQLQASARLQLPADIPAMGGRFEGTCQFTILPSDFPGVDSLNGHYSAVVFEQWITFDLTPGISDVNILIFVRNKGNTLQGTWSHSDQHGGKEMGTVMLIYK